MEEQFLVRKIKDGTVIDHIPAGKGRKVLEILGINSQSTTALLVNVPSKSIKQKDIVKVENKYLKKEDVNKIALIAPDATWNVIKNYEVTNKSKIELPNVIEEILKCPNPKCITNTNEPIRTKFFVEEKDPVRVRCNYCERLINLEEVV